MLIKKAEDIRSSEITPRSLYLNRRQFLGGAAIAGAAAASGFGLREDHRAFDGRSGWEQRSRA